VKLAWVLGLLAAVVLHAGVVGFAGLVFPRASEGGATTQSVDLLSDVESEEQKKEIIEEPPPEEERIETDDETPPDTADMLRDLETPPTDDAPALEAASLSAIEAALGGGGGGGDFAEAIGFGSGGRIGGTGTAGGSDRTLDDAFSLAELDQKPRVLFQGSPNFPAQMRGKKLEGVVALIFVVDITGKVENPRVESSTHPAFEAPALDALQKWKFEPGVRAGQRVPSKMRVQIRFPAS
jgi:protein TonB